MSHPYIIIIAAVTDTTTRGTTRGTSSRPSVTSSQNPSVTSPSTTEDGSGDGTDVPGILSLCHFLSPNRAFVGLIIPSRISGRGYGIGPVCVCVCVCVCLLVSALPAEPFDVETQNLVEAFYHDVI